MLKTNPMAIAVSFVHCVKTKDVSVTATPGLLLEEADRDATCAYCRAKNMEATGGNTVYVLHGSGTVSSTNGWPVLPGEEYPFDPSDIPNVATASGKTATVTVGQFY